jgi:hypothetical protein
MPSANIPAKMMPMAVSSLMRAFLLMAPIPSEARTAVPSAHQKSVSRVPPLTIYPSATPGNTVCASASPKKAMPRRTTYVPTTAQTMPTNMPAASPRSMNG